MNFRVTGLVTIGPKNETAIHQIVDTLEKLPGAKLVISFLVCYLCSNKKIADHP